MGSEMCIRDRLDKLPLEFVIGYVEQFSDIPESYQSKQLAKLTFDIDHQH